ncbi:protein-export membrane protein SecF [Cyanobium sp. PCC 7001]|uniref:protein translocase subunit SecF n=1 Tax=Cyanobium sp. PCC 7001 TaxID=180281 RepID=UPI0001805BC5|nr:protein translocase subunit SecF [Cyanobium sp. PCC 7001]EDY39104.1 protein-export membrane protein SecF [Cyanobium sp. PCC 7001]
MSLPSRLLGVQVNRRRRTLWALSSAALVLSLLGIAISWLTPSIRAPLRPGLDFTGGTQIQLARSCGSGCSALTAAAVEDRLTSIPLPAEEGAAAPPNLRGAAVQLLDGGQQVVLRLPSLSAEQGQAVVEGLAPVIGPTDPAGLSVETIGPTLGSRLLRASLISLAVSFVGISAYITIRYDRLFALLALLCLGHDVLITCGVFSWLGLLGGVEVNSLFAVALLTIAGYSVNDTVVIFDRIREKRVQLTELALSEQADAAVAATLTRSLYTSFTTLLPLLALILFGGSTLFWFAVALSVGVVVGAWSSVAIAPTLLPVLARS